MKNSNATALDSQADSNVIFLNPDRVRKPAEPTTSRAPAIFYQLGHPTPKEIEEGSEKEENSPVENPSYVESGDEWSRRDCYLSDIQNCSRTQLRLLYPGAYSSWKNIKQRCRKGQGVLHPAFDEFPGFLSVRGPRPAPSYTVDRKDRANPEYSPANTRWASKALQARNRRNTTVLTDASGKSLPLSEWSQHHGVPADTIRKRVERGWSVDDAVRPARPQKASAINCTATAKTDGMTLEEFCAQPVEPDAPEIAPLLRMWKKALAEQFDSPFFAVEPKHIKMLKDIARLLSDGGLDPEKVLACVLENWGGQRAGFARYATERGPFKAPRQPCLQYLRANVNHAANFYLAEKGLLEKYRNGLVQTDLEGRLRKEKNDSQRVLDQLKKAWDLHEASDDDIWLEGDSDGG